MDRKYSQVIHLLHKESIPDTSGVGYLPVIDASPVEYSTINTILKRSTEITDKLQLKYATLVFDEAVYAKIQHVRWENDSYCNRFIVRLGEFHAIMSYLSTVSKIFEDGGLKLSKNYVFLLIKLKSNVILRFIDSKLDVFIL
jgi:hypothetical protein